MDSSESTNCARFRYPFKMWVIESFAGCLRENDIARTLSPLTSGPAERMNRPSRTPRCESCTTIPRDSLKARLDAFITAYNLAKHHPAGQPHPKPSATPGRDSTTPLIINPHHLIPEPYSSTPATPMV
jgi:hypothetical protein